MGVSHFNFIFNCDLCSKGFGVSELTIAIKDTLEKSDNYQFIVSLNDM